jgi:chemotaxis response regulator CheB
MICKRFSRPSKESPKNWAIRSKQHRTRRHSSVSSFVPDLILVDVIMPEEDSLDLLRYLGSEKIRTPILLISDYGEQLLTIVAKIGSALGLNIRAIQKPLGPSAWRDLLAPDWRASLARDCNKE